MAKQYDDKGRDDGLAAVVPILLNDIERLNLRVAGLRAPRGVILDQAIGAGLAGMLFGGMAGYEGEAAEFGELKAAAEDMVDDIQNDLADLDRVVDAVRDGTNPAQRATQQAARAKAEQVAKEIREALDKAREARGKAKGAATAAKKLAAANPKLTQARTSFSEAAAKLAEYDRGKASSTTQAAFAALAVLLKDARKKIADDLVHLNAAMEAVD